MATNDDEQDREQQQPPAEARPSRRERQQAREEGDQRVPRYSVERLRSSAGPAIVARAYDGEEMPRHAAAAGTIAGALHDFEGDELTAAELRQALAAYLERTDPTATEA